VRRIVLEQVKPYASEVRVDALGNLLAYCPAAGAPHLRVLVAAHMDEVGLMLTGDEGGGFFRFTAIGGVDIRCLPGKSLQVGREHLPALIGLNPFHLASDHEVRSVPSIDDLRIDVGPDNAKKVKVGDWAAFTTPFARLGPSLRAKALDDRIGVATLIELVHNPPPHLDLVAAFTVQEEVGLRGRQRGPPIPPSPTWLLSWTAPPLEICPPGIAAALATSLLKTPATTPASAPARPFTSPTPTPWPTRAWCVT